ncbi:MULTISPECIES: hypothetical protein [unclassified Peribacillus]
MKRIKPHLPKLRWKTLLTVYEHFGCESEQVILVGQSMGELS